MEIRIEGGRLTERTLKRKFSRKVILGTGMAKKPTCIDWISTEATEIKLHPINKKGDRSSLSKSSKTPIPTLKA
jgi:hypothetical protein